MTTVGEILKNNRKNQGLTLLDIEKKIRVREKYLQAIEQGNWEMFSSKIYIIGILKNYSRVLGLDQKKILAFFRRDYEKKEEVRFKERVASSSLTSESKKVFKTLIILSFIIVFIYFGYQLKLYFSPPGFSIISPTTTHFTTEDKIIIVGKTEKDAMVSIFGERVFQNKNGLINYDFPLKEGNNKIVIEITGANGKKTTVEKIFTKKSPQ